MNFRSKVYVLSVPKLNPSLFILLSMASMNYPVIESKKALGKAMITPAVLCKVSISCPIVATTQRKSQKSVDFIY